MKPSAPPRPTHIPARAWQRKDALLGKLAHGPIFIDLLVKWWLAPGGVLRADLRSLLDHLGVQGQVKRDAKGRYLLSDTVVVPITTSEQADAVFGAGSPGALKAKEMMDANRKVAKPAPAPAEPSKSTQKRLTIQHANRAVTRAIVGRGEPDADTNAGKVLAAVRKKPGTCADVLKRLWKLEPNSVRGVLSKLTSQGWLTRDKEGVYRAEAS